MSRFGRSGTVTHVSTRTEELAVPWSTRKTAGDRAAVEVEELFARCERSIGKFLVQMVQDRSLAEDLLQDTFHDAFRARLQMLEASSADAWLFAIARNRALSALRRRRRSVLAVARLARRRDRNERDAQEIVALRDLLERHLDADQRALLLLRYLHGFDAAELAEIVGLTPEAIRQRLSRTRRKLMAAAGEER